MRHRLHTFGLSVIFALSVMSGALAQGVSQAFTYQGFLRQGGAPLTNPSQSMTFRIYDALTGGTLLWNSGAVTVNVNNGLFTVQLNAPASVWSGAERYLEIQVGATTLSPRVRLTPTPYANTATQINMFQSGVSNPNRMVITHSPTLTNWGLQYRDSDDTFHFLGGGVSQVSISLGSGLLTTKAFRLPTGATAGHVLTSDASGNASWQALPAGASIWAVSGTNIYNTNTGNVGIGTNSPSKKLEVWGDLLVNSSAGHLIIGFPSSANQWHFETMGGGAHLQLMENAANTIRMYFKAGGNIGIGTTSPTARLHIAHDSTLDSATLRLHETTADFARLEFTNTNTARKWHIAGLIGSTQADDRLNFWNSAAGDILSIRGDGTVAVKVLEITGADLAEKFPTTDTVEPGMVVEIDPDHPGHLRKARGAYNKRVAGVVAGANGLSKGIILGNLEGSESHTPIAMSGRVWVYADATECAIEPGDLLTTADRPGYAMAARDKARAHGAILGKAMTRLEKGKTGMVLVLVNLQ
ncbi:MAG: hypothetical protein KatS3mg019_0335 [Fimbriimonadales bacterium]|nr:MAG: hypothetical protein KatS3mg019_0335 [Fimbriimonadales bacterium]